MTDITKDYKYNVQALEILLKTLKGKPVQWAFQDEYDFAIRDALTYIKRLKEMEDV